MDGRKILIVFKKNNAEARELAATLSHWLRQKDISSIIIEGNNGAFDISWRPSLVIVLGGDGTVLGIARCVAGMDIPIFGINFGNVGFLAAADAGNWRERLTAALEEGSTPRECLCLKWSLARDGRIINDGVVVNDVVLGHGALARLIHIQVSIDGIVMGLMRCDGLIVCSPIGSSGYSVSAGGPLICADMNVIGLTPICPFTTNVSPLVFPASAVFELKITPHTPDCFLTLDGQDCLSISENDLIRVEASPHTIKIFGNGSLFLEKLRKRGFCLDQA